ncbi:MULTISPECIES: DUF445 domain-containing protein [unclassified Paenibacillus]|uniref:DUF445 domain-containing protein n=1 Tax=unclassified Paenibacillus TaxID=185978 RepID=UPI002405C48E|nr:MULTISPECIES: DUF445 domain-containing protein [unclassified Paenibacillus]MDF9840869.1 uncharacterized membrane-anchored protein YjiN (DUF445 family) [Paenibacillus sp. PastF-2]MDF9847453.1 uncharacterized membrane-anchored protein YjiN (DUF445 family) [Paenibacillus sp. PastM-2]MDF9853970.1 uncharacterized membrane-anchored protein YjiN (DUF445 family) [Paenibacillus sp. PastF-1]MDH6479242.1 uncharacterized membrane-anchored protein YjiN (DUF445 family) [Paenibacillus sp. PastH-2]MDH65070
MKSRNLATISLVVMACGFLITLFLPDTIPFELLRGGFEAGLVGGIADWFAVTALFRHPLGLKIPHTSLLLKNRNKIVQSLISAMENELLNKASIENKLRGIRMVKLGGGMLTKFMSRKKARAEILEQLGSFVLRLPVEQAVPYLQKTAADYIREAELGEAADQIATRLMNDGKDIAALDYALEGVSGWTGRPETRAMLGKLAGEKLAEVKLGGLKGMAFQAFVGFVDADMLGEMLQGMIQSGIRDFREADNPYREQIIREIRVALFQLVNDETKLASLKEWAVNGVQGDEAAAFLQKQLEVVRSKAVAMLDEDRASGGRKLFSLYALLVRRVSRETDLIQSWEERIRASLIALVEANHYRIGVLVKENLDQMDDDSLVNMLEEKVGKDLQWIRVNGAVCGFVVGLVLTVIQLI